MKLRNKKTGEIVVFGEGIVDLNQIGCKNVAEMMEAGWEDYEEQKDYYIINLWGEVCVEGGEYQRPGLSALGLTFETKKEAEKAVEKLKAWKRLKDRGFRFDNWDLDADDKDVNVLLRSDKYKGNQVYAFEEDLDLLFGGEE